MNILFIDQFGELGGAQQCLLELIPAIAERGWHSFAAVPSSGEPGARLSALGVRVESISLGDYSSGRKSVADLARFLVDAPRLAIRLGTLIRQHRIDLVYANGPRVLPAAALAAGRLPLVFHAHNYLPPGPGRFLVRAGLRLCANASVIAVSEFVASYLRGPAPLRSRLGMGMSSGGPARTPIEVVPNGIADLRTSRTTGEHPRIGVIGRIAPEKGQLDFVEAARLLPRDWEFVIAGTPMLAKPAYAEQVRSRATGLRIRFPGWQNDLRRLYGSLDLLIVPSAPGEGFGRVIIEAFSAEVPVIAYDSGGIRELIEDGVSGYLVRPPTPASLATAIRKAIDEPEARLDITRRARQLWQSSYTLEHYRDRVTNIIARAASKESSAATRSTGR